MTVGGDHAGAPTPSAVLAASFLRITQREQLLGAADAQSVLEEAEKTGQPPVNVALRLGLLDATAADILETLLNPVEIIPGYEILSVIGRGGMGVVFKARQLTLDRTVAVKTILVSQMADPSIAARFEKEAKTVGQLRHPNIIAAIDFGRHHGRLYFVMEYIAGEDLDRRIERAGALDEWTAWGLARQAASALAHADQLGIVHRDIKPANMMLVAPPEGFQLPFGMPMLKLADFGLAFLTTEAEARTRLTGNNSTVGSPHYIAPEQLTSNAVSTAGDIYALGASIYHMLVGEPPYMGRGIAQIIAEKVSGRPLDPRKSRPNVSAPTTGLLGELLAPDPKRRLTDYKQILRRIDEVMNDPAVRRDRPASATGSANSQAFMETQEINIGRTATTQLRQSRWRQWLIAGVVLAIVGALGIWKLRMPPAAVKFVHGSNFEELFNGQNLDDWQIVRGSWTDIDVPNDGRWIEGENGEIRKRLGKWAQNRDQVVSYELELVLRLRDAKRIEVHFAIEPDPNRSGLGRCEVLVISPTGLQRGQRDGAQPFKPIGSPIPKEIASNVSNTLKIEHKQGRWRLIWNEEAVGELPGPLRPAPEFRLRVEGGPAWFADIHVQELAPSRKER